MIAALRALVRYRALVQSLVSRELKARYRGSVLGFLWSFVNPLLLLLTYTLVFTVILPNRQPDIQPFFLFLFCGILPWTWFQASLAESSGVIIAGGNLIKKVLFPAEVLPAVTVLANLAHFLLGLPILIAFLAVQGKLAWTALLLPIPLLVQLVLTLGLALFLSALTVHFRDIQSILTHVLTSVLRDTRHLQLRRDPRGVAPAPGAPAQPDDARDRDVPADALPRKRGPLAGALPRLPRGVAAFAAGAFLFDRLRDTLPRKCERPRDRRARRDEALPALRPPQPVQDAEKRAPSPEASSPTCARRRRHRPRRRFLRGAAGLHLRRDRGERLREVHPPEARRRHHQAHRGVLSVEGRVSALIELGAGFHPEISGRENVVINGVMLGLTRREVDRRFDENRGLRGAARVSSTLR